MNGNSNFLLKTIIAIPNIPVNEPITRYLILAELIIIRYVPDIKNVIAEIIYTGNNIPSISKPE